MSSEITPASPTAAEGYKPRPSITPAPAPTGSARGPLFQPFAYITPPDSDSDVDDDPFAGYVRSQLWSSDARTAPGEGQSELNDEFKADYELGETSSRDSFEIFPWEPPRQAQAQLAAEGVDAVMKTCRPALGLTIDVRSPQDAHLPEGPRLSDGFSSDFDDDPFAEPQRRGARLQYAKPNRHVVLRPSAKGTVQANYDRIHPAAPFPPLAPPSQQLPPSTGAMPPPPPSVAIAAPAVDVFAITSPSAMASAAVAKPETSPLEAAGSNSNALVTVPPEVELGPGPATPGSARAASDPQATGDRSPSSRRTSTSSDDSDPFAGYVAPAPAEEDESEAAAGETEKKAEPETFAMTIFASEEAAAVAARAAREEAATAAQASDEVQGLGRRSETGVAEDGNYARTAVDQPQQPLVAPAAETEVEAGVSGSGTGDVGTGHLGGELAASEQLVQQSEQLQLGSSLTGEKPPAAGVEVEAKPEQSASPAGAGAGVYPMAHDQEAEGQTAGSRRAPSEGNGGKGAVAQDSGFTANVENAAPEPDADGPQAAMDTAASELPVGDGAGDAVGAAGPARAEGQTGDLGRGPEEFKEGAGDAAAGGACGHEPGNNGGRPEVGADATSAEGPAAEVVSRDGGTEEPVDGVDAGVPLASCEQAAVEQQQGPSTERFHAVLAAPEPAEGAAVGGDHVYAEKAAEEGGAASPRQGPEGAVGTEEGVVPPAEAGRDGGVRGALAPHGSVVGVDGAADVPVSGGEMVDSAERVEIAALYGLEGGVGGSACHSEDEAAGTEAAPGAVGGDEHVNSGAVAAAAETAGEGADAAPGAEDAAGEPAAITLAAGAAVEVEAGGVSGLADTQLPGGPLDPSAGAAAVAAQPSPQPDSRSGEPRRRRSHSGSPSAVRTGTPADPEPKSSQPSLHPEQPQPTNDGLEGSAADGLAAGVAEEVGNAAAAVATPRRRRRQGSSKASSLADLSQPCVPKDAQQGEADMGQLPDRGETSSRGPTSSPADVAPVPTAPVVALPIPDSQPSERMPALGGSACAAVKALRRTSNNGSMSLSAGSAALPTPADAEVPAADKVDRADGGRRISLSGGSHTGLPLVSSARRRTSTSSGAPTLQQQQLQKQPNGVACNVPAESSATTTAARIPGGAGEASNGRFSRSRLLKVSESGSAAGASPRAGGRPASTHTTAAAGVSRAASGTLPAVQPKRPPSLRPTSGGSAAAPVAAAAHRPPPSSQFFPPPSDAGSGSTSPQSELLACPGSWHQHLQSNNGDAVDEDLVVQRSDRLEGGGSGAASLPLTPTASAALAETDCELQLPVGSPPRRRQLEQSAVSEAPGSRGRRHANGLLQRQPTGPLPGIPLLSELASRYPVCKAQSGGPEVALVSGRLYVCDRLHEALTGRRLEQEQGQASALDTHNGTADIRPPWSEPQLQQLGSLGPASRGLQVGSYLERRRAEKAQRAMAATRAQQHQLKGLLPACRSGSEFGAQGPSRYAWGSQPGSETNTPAARQSAIEGSAAAPATAGTGSAAAVASYPPERRQQPKVREPLTVEPTAGSKPTGIKGAGQAQQRRAHIEQWLEDHGRKDPWVHDRASCLARATEELHRPYGLSPYFRQVVGCWPPAPPAAPPPALGSQRRACDRGRAGSDAGELVLRQPVPLPRSPTAIQKSPSFA